MPGIFPPNCYTTTVRYNSKNLLKESSVVWDMVKRSDLDSTDANKLYLLSKDTRRVTNYSLTRKFITRIDSAYCEKARTAKKISNEALKDGFDESSIPLFTFKTYIENPIIEDISLISACHFFLIGHRGIFIPFAGSHLYLLDIYSNNSASESFLVLHKHL